MARYNTILLAGGATINNATFTGQSLFADGSASAPSIAFSSNPTTGLFWNSSGDFRTTINGTSKLLFNSGGVSPTSDDSIPIGGVAGRWTTIHTRAITIGQSLTNPNMGEVTLSGASATAIAYTSALTAGARIFLSKVLGRGTQGSVYVTSSTNGVSFTVQSTSTTDTSVVAWWVVPVT